MTLLSFLLPLPYTPDLYGPVPAPDRIILTIPGNAETTMAASWRTRPGAKGQAQIVAYGPRGLEGKPALVPSGSEQVTGEFGPADYHQARFTGLEAGKSYAYRVSAGDAWSPWHVFRTASKNRGMKLLLFGDAQAKIKSVSAPLFIRALMEAPDADAIIHAGDLIDNNMSDREWGEWHYAMNSLGRRIPSLPTPGNHEYGQPGPFKGLSPWWKPMFPMDHPSPAPGTGFAVGYQGVRIFSLDSMTQREAQYQWLEQEVPKPGADWQIMTTHIPVFASMEGKEFPGRAKRLQSICDLGVDLAFTGHHHAYSRSRLLKGQEDATGTVYAIANSGGKHYKLDLFDWMSVAFPRIPTFQVIEAMPGRLDYRAMTVEGEVMDQFALVKGSGRTTLEESIAAPARARSATPLR